MRRTGRHGYRAREFEAHQERMAQKRKQRRIDGGRAALAVVDVVMKGWEKPPRHSADANAWLRIAEKYVDHLMPAHGADTDWYKAFFNGLVAGGLMKKKPLNVRRESTSLSGLLQEMRGGRKIDKMAGYLIRKMKGLSGAKFKGAQTIKYSTRGKIGGGRGGPLKFPIALVVDGEVLRTFATKEKRSEFISWAKQNGFGVATEDDLRVARRSGAGQAQKRTSPPPGKTSMAAVRQAIENAESLAAHAKSIAKALRDQPVSEANVRRADLIMLAVDMMVQFLEEAVTKNREPSSFAIDTMKRMGSSIAAKLQ